VVLFLQGFVTYRLADELALRGLHYSHVALPHWGITLAYDRQRGRVAAGCTPGRSQPHAALSLLQGLCATLASRSAHRRGYIAFIAASHGRCATLLGLSG